MIKHAKNIGGFLKRKFLESESGQQLMELPQAPGLMWQDLKEMPLRDWVITGVISGGFIYGAGWIVTGGKEPAAVLVQKISDSFANDNAKDSVGPSNDFQP